MKKNDTFILVIVIGIIILAVVYIPDLINKKSDNINKRYEEIKDYKVNEYIPVYVDDEQMSRIYLMDYINIINSDIDKSYNLLDQDYRLSRFSSIDDYKSYISSLNLSNSNKVTRYSTYEKKKYKYYDIYDSNNNRFIFKTNGVLQYVVLFEDE